MARKQSAYASDMAELPHKLDNALKVLSMVCSAIVLPGIGWAWQTSSSITELSGKVEGLAQQLDSERRSGQAVVEELRLLRTSIDAMRTDLLQRMTRVETRIESR
jgi:hypothetical protein